MSPEDEGRLRDEVVKSGKAREVLENEVFKGAVRQVEEALLHGMRHSAIVDEKLKLRLLDRYELLHSLLDVLRSTMETGLFASAQLEAEEKKSLYDRALKAVGWE